MIDGLTPQAIDLLARRHKLPVRWNEPWKKSRTGGSDDHALLNIGRTWTEFPAECDTIDDLLECIRTGRCQPGGEADQASSWLTIFSGLPFVMRISGWETTRCCRCSSAAAGRCASAT